MNVETDAVLTEPTHQRATLLERHLRAKLTRMYARTATRQQRAPSAMQKAAEKRARKAQKRKATLC